MYRSIHDSRGTDSRASVVHAARNWESPRRNFPEALLLWTLPNDGHHRRYARKNARASLDILLAFPRAVPFRPAWTNGKEEEKRATLCVYSPRDAGLSRTRKQEKERKKESERGRERERGRKLTLPRQIRARSFLRAYAPYIRVRVHDNLLVNVVIILKILLLLFSCRARRR